MFGESIGVIVAWIIAVLARAMDLKAPEVAKKRIAWAIIAFATAAAAYSLCTIARHHHRKTIEHFDESTARYLQEASGGTAFGRQLLLVDDEVTAILRLQRDGDGGLAYRDHLWLVENGRQLSNRDIDDLEGVAADPSGRFIYAVTSHSNTRTGTEKPERSQFIRGCIAGGRVIVLDRLSLAVAFRRALFESGIARPFAVAERAATGAAADPIEIGMEIEGLAVDRSGALYFGFRAPLSTRGSDALVARIDPRKLFADPTPPCVDRPPPPPVDVATGSIEVLRVPMHKDGNRYGIVSADFDAASGKIVLIGNSPQPYAALRPIACAWDPAAPPMSRNCDKLAETSEPYWGKQEALVLDTEGDGATMFIDGDKGLGGYIAYARSELGL
jgi:hypothetical protein